MVKFVVQVLELKHSESAQMAIIVPQEHQWRVNMILDASQDFSAKRVLVPLHELVTNAHKATTVQLVLAFMLLISFLMTIE